MFKFVVAIACCLLLLAASASFAQVGTIQDPGYETGGSPDAGSPQGGITPYWNNDEIWNAARCRLEATSHIYNGSLPCTEGSQAMCVSAGGSSIADACDVYQTIQLAANTTYALSVDICAWGSLFNGGSNPTDWAGVGYTFMDSSYIGANGNPAYGIGNGGTYVPADGLQYVWKTGTPTGAQPTYTTVTFDVTNSTSSVENCVIGYTAYFGAGNNCATADGVAYWSAYGWNDGMPDQAFVLADNWTIAVPEPGSLLALGTGLIGLLGAALRKRA